MTRANLFLKLCAHWIRKHRPDVANAVQEEVDKQLPLKVRNKVVALPASLKELK